MNGKKRRSRRKKVRDKIWHRKAGTGKIPGTLAMLLVFVLLAGSIPATAYGKEEAGEGEDDTNQPDIEAYTVTVHSSSGGTVLLNGQPESELIVEEGTLVEMSVCPEEKHQIASVIIDEVEEVIDDAMAFSKELTINQDTEIKVTFVSLHTVTVIYDKDKGAAITTPDSPEGSVTVKEGEEVLLEATPNPNYRISRVNKNQEEFHFTENDKAYTDIISEIDKDYQYEIFFAPNTFEISVVRSGKGSIFIEHPKVEHGGSTRAILTPDSGYVLEAFCVNGEEALATQINNEQLSLLLEDITEDKQLEAIFQPMPVIDFTEVLFNEEDAARMDSKTGLYVFPKGIEATVSTLRQGIKINGKGDWKINSQTFTEATHIKDIQIYYQGEGDIFPIWHRVKLPEDGIRLVFDQSAPTITLTPQKPQMGTYYTRDVKVELWVEEPKDDSGIQSVEYWIEKDGDREAPTQSGVLFQAAAHETEKAGSIWNGSIVVDAAKNNSCDVRLFVKATDNAGNERVTSQAYDIDITPPAIEISYDNNKDNGGNSYFDAPRTATITVRERSAHFDEKAATEGIVITARDAMGRELPVDYAKMISGWSTQESAQSKNIRNRKESFRPEEATHTATIAFNEDANYTLSVALADKAGNQSAPADTGASAAPYRFTVDTKSPTGMLQAASREGRIEVWEELVSPRTFGFFSNQEITILGTATDATSPISSMQYYKTDNSNALTEAELREVTDWTPMEELVVTPGQQTTIYCKIVDFAGHVSYISTDGLIVDDTAPRTEALAPEITVTPQQPVNDIYTGDVKVGVAVEEPLAGGTFAGIKTISYRVLNMGQVTQNGVLYSFSENMPCQEQLRKSWAGEITVEAEKNNSNDVIIEIFTEDNAGNSSREKTAVKIDVTAPVVTVSYDNNRADSEIYYKEARTATVVVTERNFAPEAVELILTNTNGELPVLSGWSETPGTGAGDDTMYTATVVFGTDGDYTFKVNCADLAGNICPGVDYIEGTKNPTAFTIDTTLPVVSVSYDNNQARNGDYFQKSRTATVTVTEHNFDKSRVSFTQTASRDGEAIVVPTASWSSDGDVHRAVFSYEADGDYTFDVKLTDLAGNESGAADFGSSVAGQDFTIDTIIEEPKITGVADGHAYMDAVVPGISFGDLHFDGYEIRLTRTRMFEKNVDVTEDFIGPMDISARGGSGVHDNFAKIRENDGIYTLYVRVEDKAGNESEKTVSFSVNRFGSVYVYSDYLYTLIGNGGAYIQAVKEDFTVTEYNANRLMGDSLEIQITRDGKPVPEVAYQAAPVPQEETAVGDSGWFQYRYTIPRENFAGDGVYKMSIASRDAAGNTPETENQEGKAIMFRVDSTPPEISSITGLEQAIANAAKVQVEYTVFDAIGLSSVEVYVDGRLHENGVTDFSAGQNHCAGAFTLAEAGTSQRVRFVVKDRAGNVIDTDAADFDSAYPFHRDITVSTNFLVRWYAHKVLFWGSVGGAFAAIAGICGIRAGRNKKKR